MRYNSVTNLLEGREKEKKKEKEKYFQKASNLFRAISLSSHLEAKVWADAYPI